MRKGPHSSGSPVAPTVPLLILVPQVTMRKRLDVDGAAQKWIRAMPRLALRHWQR
jgi:hypothetical protein